MKKPSSAHPLSPNRKSVHLSIAGAACGLALLTASVPAKAACGGAQPYVACTDVNVTTLYIEAGGNAYIRVDGNPESMPCALNGGYITLSGSAQKFNAVYATLLATQSQGKRVSIRLGPEALCTVAYVTLSSPQ